MKCKSFRASRGIKSRGYNEPSSFSDDLMKRKSFAREGETEFRRGLRVDNGTTNRLLSLMI